MRYGSSAEIMKKMRIAVLSLHGMGNQLMNTAGYKLLKQKNPKSKITIFVMQETCKYILKYNKNVDKVIVLPSNKFLLLWEIRKYKFDKSYCFYPEGRGSWIIHRFLRSKLKVDFPINYVAKTSGPDENLIMAGGRGKAKYDFNYPVESKTFANKFWKKYNLRKNVVGIHTGSHILTKWKRWGWQNFAKLININPKRQFLVFGGPHDVDDLINMKALTGKNTIYADNQNLFETAALLDKCKIVVSTSSGIGHLAGAVGKRVITLFKVKRHMDGRPIGEQNVHLLGKISVETVNRLIK